MTCSTHFREIECGVPCIKALFFDSTGWNVVKKATFWKWPKIIKAMTSALKTRWSNLMHRVHGGGCCKKGGTGVGIGGSGTGARIGGNRHRNGNTYLFRSFCPNPAPVPPFLHHYCTYSTFSLHSCTTTPPPTLTPVPPFLPHSGTCSPPIMASFKTNKKLSKS